VLLLGALLQRGRSDVVDAPQKRWHVEAPAAPSEAPSWELPDPRGATHTSADLAGRPVLLNFWASWCPPCLDEMPSLQRLVAAMKGTDLVVVAVTLDEDWDAAALAMERTGFGDDVLVLLDPDRKVAHSFGTFKVPETYLVDRQGRIAHRFVGPKDWNDPQLIADVKAFVRAGEEEGEGEGGEGEEPPMNADGSR